MEGVKGIGKQLGNVWNIAKSGIGLVGKGASLAWKGIKGAAGLYWKGIKGFYGGIWKGAKKATDEYLGKIKSRIFLSRINPLGAIIGIKTQ